MNKSVVLGMAMALGVTASAYAANPFSDVPANSWAYDAVNKLAAEGIIDGYPNGTFGGDRLMTRYEMAQIVAKAMAKGANVDRLAAEFADELDSLGVRVAGLEKKSDNVKITGEIRARYVDQKAKANQGSKYDSDLRSRLWLNGQINDDWTYTAMIQNIQDFSNDQGDEGTDFKRAYVNGRVGGVGLQAGRIDAFLADGNIMDAQADGLVATYGDRIKVKAYMGKASDDTDFDVNNVIATKKGDLLTLLAGKGINLLSDIKNKIITIVGKSKNAWNPNEEIIAGDIRYTEDGNGPSWVYLLCKTAGTTGTIEPILEANAVVGQEINDGSVVWTVQKNSNALSFAGKEADLFALLNSPDFKGTPTAPTAAKTVNSTQIATTAFVHLLAGAANNGGIVDSLLAQNGYVKFANGLILQWGFCGAGTINLPISFVEQIFICIVTDMTSSVNNSDGYFSWNPDKSAISSILITSSSGAGGGNYIVIGF